MKNHKVLKVTYYNLMNYEGCIPLHSEKSEKGFVYVGAFGVTKNA